MTLTKSAFTDSSAIDLYVDLDGTLIKSDVSFESLILLLKHNLLYLLLLPVWLSKGLANLKREIARRVDVPVRQLPMNPEFFEFLKQEKNAGRRLILISASDEKFVSAVGKTIDVFDQAIGSDGEFNLKAANKLQRILELSGDKPFAYAGNSRADLPIWAHAHQAILVNCPSSLGENLSAPDHVQHYDPPAGTARLLFKAMRPHQWLKNGLVFLPLLLAHQLGDLALVVKGLMAFVSFSLCASSVYLLNDLTDLNSDRLHPGKRSRPFAAGTLPLATGLAAIPALLLSAFIIALFLPLSFLGVLLLYWLLTTAYSLVLKRLFLVDVLVLAALYTLRIIAGAAAVSVPATHWLIAFALCLFLGLAIVKRVTELVNRGDESAAALAGRAYQWKHLELLTTMGISACSLAVLVFILYINDPATRALYGTPFILWLVCPLLIYLLWRIWTFARSGRLHDDPLIFAISDHLSQAIVVLCGVLIWLAI